MWLVPTGGKLPLMIHNEFSLNRKPYITYISVSHELKICTCSVPTYIHKLDREYSLQHIHQKPSDKNIFL